MTQKQLKLLCAVLAVLTAGSAAAAVRIRADSRAPAGQETSLAERADRLEEENAALSAEKAALETETARLEKALSSLSSEQAALKEENAVLAAEKAGLEENKAALEAENAALASEKEDLAAEKTALEQEKAALSARLAQRNEEFLSQYKLYKNVLSQDEVEQVLFGQPISTERNGEYRIGVKTAADGDYHAELTVYLARDGRYEPVFRCPALIGKNGPGKQAEGDKKTPLGTWTVGEAYGIKPDPGSILPYTQVTEDMYWCATGSNGKRYNTLIRRSDDPTADYSEDEHLIEYGDVYNYLLFLGYNAPGAPYAGNAIFLHCWRSPESPTGGCVAVAEESMVQILRTVTPGTAVTIY